MTKQKTSFYKQAYKEVCKVPKGKVVTYGQIAKKVGVDPRMVGWALHANKDIKIPCHRVVNKEGKLASNFAFDGAKEQRRRLLAERVKFIDEMHVDFKRCLSENVDL
ncbi:MGMT family protein [Patescibacteria group bacterium]